MAAPVDPPRRGLPRPGWRLILLLVVVCLGLAVAWANPPTLLELRRWIQAVGPWAPLLYVLLQASRGVTWLPGSLLSPLGGVCFGLRWGLAYSWVGLLGAAALGFALARMLGRSSGDPGRRGLFDRFLERAGGRPWLAVLLARLLPGIPFNVVSYLAGATSMRWPAYLAASAVGLLPRMAVQVSLGAGLYSVAALE